jgi:hypothetical protein
VESIQKVRVLVLEPVGNEAYDMRDMTGKETGNQIPFGRGGSFACASRDEVAIAFSASWGWHSGNSRFAFDTEMDEVGCGKPW